MTIESVTFTMLKYADILGKPLTKSVYRQLPLYNGDWWINRDDVFTWTAIVHGLVNWCPPKCEAETLCDCDYRQPCRRLPRCKMLRPHQHVLVGEQGMLYQGYLYFHILQDEDCLWKETHWKRYEPLEREREELAVQKRAYDAQSISVRLSSPGLINVAQQRNARLAMLASKLDEIGRQARHDFGNWVRASLKALPVILLRG